MPIGELLKSRPGDSAASFLPGDFILTHADQCGFGTMSGVALSVLTGSCLSFWHSAHDICSGLVAHALERTLIIFERDPMDMLPGDLAKACDVRSSHQSSAILPHYPTGQFDA